MHGLTPLLRNYFTLRGALLGHHSLPWALEEGALAQLQQAVANELALAERALVTSGESGPSGSDGVVQEGVESFLAQLQCHGSASAILARAGLDGAQLRRAVAAELRVAAVLEQVVADAEPDEAALRALYEQNRERFVAPERREVFHILITVNDDYPDNRREPARKRIMALARQLAQGGDFGELALRHSECPSAVEAGRLGVVVAGQLYPELDEKLFVLQQGEISTVVESPLGFHLLRCGTIEAARSLAWDEVKPSLSRRIAERARRRRLQEWLQGL